MPVDTIGSLVDALRQHRLLEAPQLEEVTSGLQRKFEDPRTLARDLVQRGWLTPYQVNLLFQGRVTELLLGSYIILERLGEGGMGQVFKARHAKLGRIVAIKIIRKDRLSNSEAVNRFQREIRAAAQLIHPNVVMAYDADQIADRHLIVMEYVEGIDLARLIKERGPVSVKEACEYIRQGALGLQHAFERGLVHRDIKPSNLFLSTDSNRGGRGAPVVKLLDLGLARVMSSLEEEHAAALTQDGQVVGTPDYIAPEQARNAHQADIRADIYSLGCTLFFLLTGRPPFPGGSMTEKLLKHHWDAPPEIDKLRQDVPPVLAGIIRKLLAKRVEDRYQTPAELAAALASVVSGNDQTPQPMMAPATPPPAIPVAMPLGVQQAPLPQAQMATPHRDDTTVVGTAREQPAARKPPDTRRWLLLAGAGGGGLLVLMLLIVWWARPGPGQSTGRTNRAPTAPQELVLSPLDKLNKDAIPAGEHIQNQPKEMVALIGEHRGRHYGAVDSLAFSPDGSTIASGGQDGMVRLWDPSTMQQRLILRGSRYPVMAVAYTPNGKLLAAADSDGNVRFWNTSPNAAREPIVFKPHNESVNALAFSSDGKVLATASDDQDVHLWRMAGMGEPQKGEPQKGPRLGGHTDSVTAVAFSPDNKQIATAGKDRTVRLWFLGGFEPRLRMELSGFSDSVLAVAFSPDGKTLAAGTADGFLRFWEVARFRPMEIGKGISVGREGIGSLTWAPDQTLLCGLYDGSIALVDVSDTTQKLRSRVKENTSVTAVAFDPKNMRMASGTYGGTVRVWDWNAGQPRERQAPKGHAGPIRSLAFTPDGKTLASAAMDQGVRLWNLTGAEPKESLVLGNSWEGAGVAFSPVDSKQLAASNRSKLGFFLWHLPNTTGQEYTISRGDSVYGGPLAYAPNGKLLAIGGQDGPRNGVIHLWDMGSAEPRDRQTLRGHLDRVTALAFSPDGKRLASAGESDRTLRLWDSSGQELSRLQGPMRTSFTSVAFRGPDGDMLAAGSTDNSVRVWDIKSLPPRELTPIPSHTQPVRSVAFSSDGQLLATAGDDGRVTLWDPVTEKNLADWLLPGAIDYLAFAPDNRHLAIGNANGTIYIFRVKPAPGRK